MSLPIEPTGLIQYGLLGLVLGWFMWRNEKVMNLLVDKIDKLCLVISKNAVNSD